MKRPFKFSVICNKTGRFLYETDLEPILPHLQTYEPTENPNVSKLVQTKTAYIDTRYKAKLRLYNYLRSKRCTP